MRSSWTPVRAVLVAVAMSSVATAGLEAQACIGVGSHDGQGFMVGGAAFTDEAWGPSLALGYDAHGPVTFGVEGVYTMIDNSSFSLVDTGAFFAAEVPGLGFSLCPVASGSYTFIANDGGFNIDGDQFTFGGGLAVGGTISSSPDFAFLPSLTAQVVHSRATGSVGGASGTVSATHARLGGALILGFGPVFVGPSISILTADGADPVIAGRLGVAF